MHIVCPHCTTSYAIDLATLGGAGRTVRCSRCKEIWLARPEDAIEVAAVVPAMAAAGDQQDAADEWERLAAEGDTETQDTPVVDSPSISADWPAGGVSEADSSETRHDMADSDATRPSLRSRLRNLFKPRARIRTPGRSRLSVPFAGGPTACAAMGALVLALVIWRVEMVRLLPQTASFYKMVGDRKSVV